MSQTTTAASSGVTRPSFDFVLSCFPEELSASSRACDLDGPRTPPHLELPELPHGADASSSPRVNVASLCRNTFVHLESASPLAKLSHSQLLESFKNFSNKLNTHYNTNGKLQLACDNQGVVSSGQDQKEVDSAKEAIWTTDSASHVSLREPDCVPIASSYRPTSGSARSSPFFLDDEKRIETPRKEPKEAFDLSEWKASLIERESESSEIGATMVRGSLYTLLADPGSTSCLTNLFACAIAQSLLQPLPQEDRKRKEVELKQKENETAEAENSGHPLNCKPCAFFWSKGCLNGDSCQFCHMWHVPKRKKPMKEQKNLMIIAREDGKIAFLRCAIQDALTI